MSPRPSVTGSISTQHLPDARVAPVEAELQPEADAGRSTGSAIANWTTVPTRTPIA